MAITQALCTSFKQELVTGVHDFTAGTGDTFKIALYTNSATLDASTTQYTTNDEISGDGYTAGGAPLISVTPAIFGSVAICDFDDVTWNSATFVTRGALIYNSSKSDKAVCVLDFGADKPVNTGDFSIIFPEPDNLNAIIRIS